MASLVALGIPWADAWHMSPLDSHRVIAIASADSIPPDMREGGVVLGTAASARATFGTF